MLFAFSKFQEKFVNVLEGGMKEKATTACNNFCFWIATNKIIPKYPLTSCFPILIGWDQLLQGGLHTFFLMMRKKDHRVSFVLATSVFPMWYQILAVQVRYASLFFVFHIPAYKNLFMYQYCMYCTSGNFFIPAVTSLQSAQYKRTHKNTKYFFTNTNIIYYSQNHHVCSSSTKIIYREYEGERTRPHHFGYKQVWEKQVC